MRLDKTPLLQDLLFDLHLVRRKWSVDKFGYNTFYGAELTPSQAHALIRIESHSLGISELARKLHLDQSTTSRIAQSLTKLNLVSAKTEASDGRNRKLAITTKGRRVLNNLLSNQDDATRSVLNSLPNKEQIILGEQLNSLADGFNIERLNDGSYKSHPVSLALRRLTPVYGILGGSNAESDLNFAELQIMRTFSKHGKTPLSHLYKTLPYEPSFIRRSVNRLENLKVISREKKSSELARLTFELTTKGTQELERLKITSSATLKGALNNSARANLDKIIELLSRIRLSATPISSEASDISFSLLKETQDLDLARRIWIKNIKLDKTPGILPGRIFLEEDNCIGAFYKNKLIGAVAISDHTKFLKLEAIALNHKALSREDLLLSAIRLLFNRTEADSVIIPSFYSQSLLISKAILSNGMITKAAF